MFPDGIDPDHFNSSLDVGGLDFHLGFPSFVLGVDFVLGGFSEFLLHFLQHHVAEQEGYCEEADAEGDWPYYDVVYVEACNSIGSYKQKLFQQVLFVEAETCSRKCVFFEDGEGHDLVEVNFILLLLFRSIPFILLFLPEPLEGFIGKLVHPQCEANNDEVEHADDDVQGQHSVFDHFNDYNNID